MAAFRDQQTEAPQADSGGVSWATGLDSARQGDQDRYSVRGQHGKQDLRPPGPARDTGAGWDSGTDSYHDTSQHSGTAYGNEPADPHALEYSAGSGDTAASQYRDEIPHSGTSSRPPQRDASSWQHAQHPAVPGPPPPIWSQQGDDSLGLVRKEGKAPPLRKQARDQQARASRPEQSPPPAGQGPAVDKLLKRLPMAADDQEFWSILREILSPGVPPEFDRRRARREIDKPEWYVQMEQSGRVLDINMLSQLFQKIVIPDLDDPLVVKMITEWASDKHPPVVGGLLAAASESAGGIWHSVMQILQPKLAYRWLAENGMESLWDPGTEPQPDSEPGRGRFSFWKKN